MLRSPIGPCVRVRWPHSIEFVPVYPNHEHPTPFETIEYWPESGRWTYYCPSIIVSRSPEVITYELLYDPKDHLHLKDHEINWGTSKIAVDQNQRSVHLRWADARAPNNFRAIKNCQLVEQGERIRANARPTVRNQIQIRSLLLGIDKVCAITGEGTESTLECAHIVEVKSNGYESYDNAILLRADLHCLYDDGSFEISPDGKVVLHSSKLSSSYRDLLQGKVLEAKIVRRVAASLRARGPKGAAIKLA